MASLPSCTTPGAALRLRLLPRRVHAVEQRGQRQRLLGRHVDVLAQPRVLALEVRDQRAHRRVGRRVRVDLRQADAQRRAVRLAGQEHRAARGRHDQSRSTRSCAFGPSPPNGRERDVDQRRVRAGERVVVEAERAQPAGRLGLDQEVGARREPRELGAARRRSSRSSTTLRFPRAQAQNGSERSGSGSSFQKGPRRRCGEPPGGSTRTTSAPRSARICPQSDPSSLASSSTRKPCSTGAILRYRAARRRGRPRSARRPRAAPPPRPRRGLWPARRARTGSRPAGRLRPRRARRRPAPRCGSWIARAFAVARGPASRALPRAAARAARAARRRARSRRARRARPACASPTRAAPRPRPRRWRRRTRAGVGARASRTARAPRRRSRSGPPRAPSGRGRPPAAADRRAPREGRASPRGGSRRRPRTPLRSCTARSSRRSARGPTGSRPARAGAPSARAAPRPPRVARGHSRIRSRRIVSRRARLEQRTDGVPACARSRCATRSACARSSRSRRTARS